MLHIVLSKKKTGDSALHIKDRIFQQITSLRFSNRIFENENEFEDLTVSESIFQLEGFFWRFNPQITQLRNHMP